MPTSVVSSINNISYNQCKRLDGILETYLKFKTFLDYSETWRRNIGNSEQPDNNQRNVNESYSTEMNEVLEVYRIFTHTSQKMKFSIKDFFSKCDQIRSFLRIWSDLLNKSLVENFISCAASWYEIGVI